MFLIRKDLRPQEGSQLRQRYNPDCDCVETSVDGGLTWTENPDADPRINPAYLLPPNSEPDVKCAAAGGMLAYIRSSVDRTVASLTMVELANALIGIIAIFFPIALIVEIVWGVATLLLGIGTASIAAAFTEDVYAQILCLLYCQLDADGRIDSDGLAQFFTKVSSQIGDPVVDATLSALLQPLGFVGLSDAGARLADPETECDECVCTWCWHVDFRETDGGFDFDTYGEWVAGEGWQLTPTPSALSILKAMSPTTSIDSIRAAWYNSGGDGIARPYYYDGSYHALTITPQNIPNGESENWLLSPTTTIDLPNIVISANCDDGSIVYLRWAEFTGRFPPNPLGSDNC